jgi:shikimate kinase
MKYLKSRAKVIFLNVSEKELEKRINNFSSRGIARKPGQSFSSLFRERQKLYLKSCDYEIHTDDISIQATLGMVEKIARS